MAEKIKSQDQMNITIDALITMIVEELSDDLRKDPTDILADFCVSKTGRALYDTSTNLWWNGPSYIADIYKSEVDNRKKEENQTV